MNISQIDPQEPILCGMNDMIPGILFDKIIWSETKHNGGLSRKQRCINIATSIYIGKT